MSAVESSPAFGAEPPATRLDPGARGRLIARLRGAGMHLAVSLTIAVLLILLVTKVWYPAPFFDMVQGRDIFFLIVGCDITLGPAMTLIIFDTRKPRKVLARDIAVIACVQLAAMAYGVYALAQVRPAYIVFNVARFNVTLANELVDGIDKSDQDAPRPSAPWTGPQLVGTRELADGKEKSDLIFSALGGRGDIFQIPRYFVAYSDVKPRVLAHLLGVPEIAKMVSADPSVVEQLTAPYRQRNIAFGLLPLVLRQTTAIAVVDSKTGDLLGIEAIPRKL